MEGAVVDTLQSGSEGTPLKTTVGIQISESAVADQARLRDNRASAEQENKVPSATKWPCVPEIVVMDSASGVSFSPCDSLKSKDTCSSTKNKKRRGKKSQRKDQDMRASVLAEGQQLQAAPRRGELARPEAGAISSEPMLFECSWVEFGLAAADTAFGKHSAMERADISPSYTSDEWEVDSVDSDTDDDHTDSSDDDDPKSQVDRLIDRSALRYVEDENSALSSEDESDSDDDDYDSESDITDVSPLMSASASPVGLSPVLPRRTIPTSPLALHDNRELSFSYDPDQSPFIWDSPPESRSDHRFHHHPNDNNHHHHESTNMDLLLQAVIELEHKNQCEKISNLNHQNNRNSTKNSSSALPPHSPDQMYIHPIHDNPHHHHLRKNVNRRKNMSFSNEEVRKIDQENKILLKKIMAAHTRTKPGLISPHHTFARTYQKPSNSSVNRKKGEEKIRKENLLLFKKIQEAKPSKDIVDRHVSPMGGIEPLLSAVGVPNSSLRSPTSSCGAFMRSIAQPPHVSVPPPRKETAL